MMSRRYSRRVQSLLLTFLILLTCIPSHVHADEGMYLPDSIAKLPFEQLKSRGLKISASEIYNPSLPSLADAVGHVGTGVTGGGSGAFVSSEGLMLTNHHVAFDALVAASSATHDYAEMGFIARTRAEELPARDYKISLTKEIKDITADVQQGIPDTLSATARYGAITRRIAELQRTASPEEAKRGLQSRILPLYEGLRYYKFTSLVLRDVRIVYAPPKSIGYYGGDEDNFQYPRHSGDFAFLRAYVGIDGQPADYSKTNVPFKPEKFLTLNADGIKEGDFMMVLGYPDSSHRFRESYSVAYNQNSQLPIQINFLRQRIQSLQGAIRRDPALRNKVQGHIMTLSNTLKALEGGLRAIRRADLVAQKRASEEAFKRYVVADHQRQAEFGAVLPALNKTYHVLDRTGQHDQLVAMLLTAGSALDYVTFVARLAAEREKPEAMRNQQLLHSTQGIQQRLAALADRNVEVEREIYTYLFKQARQLPATQPVAALEKRFGSLQGDSRRETEARFINTMVSDAEMNSAVYLDSLVNMSLAQLRALDRPLINFALDLNAEVEAARERTRVSTATFAKYRPLLLKGMSLMHRTPSYPDANSTLRFTYGEVKSLQLRPGLAYQPFTKLSGVIDKDTGQEPFNVPDKLKQLYRAHDFARYAFINTSDVPVNFIATTDIIGGNSGSPIMNGRGEQVGIVFDNNYEGLGNDFFYSEKLQRTIAVDIRYVLFITDKFAGAGYILDELSIKGSDAKAVAAQTR